MCILLASQERLEPGAAKLPCLIQLSHVLDVYDSKVFELTFSFHHSRGPAGQILLHGLLSQLSEIKDPLPPDQDFLHGDLYVLPHLSAMLSVQQGLDQVLHARGLLRLEEALRGAGVRVHYMHMSVELTQL